MPERIVALFRGINLGSAKRVPMAELRTVLTDLGYRDVRTLLNSGNAVFTAPRAGQEHAGRIAAAVADRVGVSARVFTLTSAELEVVITENPFASMGADPARLLVAVFASAGDRAGADALTREDWTPEVLAVGSRAAYLWCPDGVAAGRLAFAIDRRLGDGVTARNWATILKIRAAL